VSNDGSKAMPGIEPLSFGQDMALDNHPTVCCVTSFEGFDAMHPNEKVTHTLTMEQQSLEAMQLLESPASRKKKSIHCAVKLGVSMMQKTCNCMVNDNAVGNRVPNFQPLEDKDQAGDIETSTAKDLNDLGQFEPFLTFKKD
jgi:hypothetical protein